MEETKGKKHASFFELLKNGIKSIFGNDETEYIFENILQEVTNQEESKSQIKNGIQKVNPKERSEEKGEVSISKEQQRSNHSNQDQERF